MPAKRQKIAGITIWRLPFMPIYPFHIHYHGIYVSRLLRRIEHQLDLIHLHSPLPPAVTAEKPILLTIHSPIRNDVEQTPVTDLYSLLMKLQAPMSFALEKRLLRRATAVNSVSPQVAEAIKSYPFAPAEVRTTWNGVDSSLFRPARVRQGSEPTVLSVSRLVPGKGLKDLIQAAEIANTRCDRIRFRLVGEGPLRSSLEKNTRSRNLANVFELLGHVGDRRRLVRLYQSATVFVLPSHHEGLPTVILEAMACAKPVIATGVGGVPSVIRHGENGLMVPPGSPEQLADALCALLVDSELRNELGVQARKTIEERFSWGTVTQNYLDLYAQLLNEGPP